MTIDTLLIAGRDLRRFRTAPAARVISWLFPVLVAVMLGSLFGGALAPPGIDYYDLLMPGMLIVAAYFGIEATAAAIAADLQRGVTDRLRSMPIGRGAILGGRVLADLLDSVVAVVVVAVAGVLLGWRPQPTLSGVSTVVTLLVLLRLGFACLGIYLGLLAGRPENLMALQIVVWPILFCSNLFVDPATMPRWLGTLAEWNPLSAATTVARDRLGSPGREPNGFVAEHTLGIAWAGALALIVVFGGLALRTFAARAEG